MKQVLFFILIISCFYSCKQDTVEAPPLSTIHTIAGKTMGTYYQIRYLGTPPEGLQHQLDSLLLALDLELSTYNKASVISQINQGGSFVDIQAKQPTEHFIKNIELAKTIHKKTNGFFDPTVMPLVNYWGFGYDPSAQTKKVDSTSVDSIQRFVGFDKFQLIYRKEFVSFADIKKNSPSVQIDLSAIAKGYGVDQLARFLEAKGLKNYLVDIGGEVVGKGYKATDAPWLIGVAIPKETASPSDYLTAVAIENAAMATSGNYRNFHEIDGVKYSHTINPFTGYPERSRLLSASILAQDCATADAFATACMVAGLEKGLKMIESNPDIEGLFVFSDNTGQLHTKVTGGFPEITENKDVIHEINHSTETDTTSS